MKLYGSLIGVITIFIGMFSSPVHAASLNETLTDKLEQAYHLDYPKERVVLVNTQTLSDAPYTAVVYDIPSYNKTLPLVKWKTRDVRFYNSTTDKLVSINKVNSVEANAFYDEYQPSIQTRLHLQTIFFGLLILVPVLLLVIRRRKREKVIKRADI